MNIMVLDGDNRAALAITRSLGRKGHAVFVGEREQPSIAGVSRFCRRRFRYPDPAHDEERFIAAIRDEISRQGVEVLLPVSDLTTLTVAAHRENFEQFCRVPFTDHPTLMAAADKAYVHRLAQELNIPSPMTVLVHAGRRESDLSQVTSFPVVIKPHRSRVRIANRWYSTKVSYADNEGELRASVAGKAEWEFPLLIQERINGPGEGAFYCYDRGKPVAFFAHRRLREKPPSGGVSVLRESIASSRDLRAASEPILDRLAWHGVAMIEFKRDDRDGTLKLMEINGRFWGSLQLAIDAGMDFPDVLVKTATGSSPTFTDRYDVGVKTRWLWGDFDSLLMILLKSRRKLKVPPGHPGRLASLMDFLCLRGTSGVVRNEVLDREDMKPWIYESLTRFGGRSKR